MLTILPLTGYAEKITEVSFKLTPESTPGFISGIKETLREDDISTQDLDSLALKITECININMERFLSVKRQKTCGTKWWNSDCREKAYEYRRARKLGDATTEKHALRKATRAAKKGHWQSLIQNAKCPSDIFKITSWHKNKGSFSGPPIIYEGITYEDSVEKASVLTKALLQRRNIDDIIEKPPPPENQAKLQVKNIVNEVEVERCLLDVTSSAPGADGISVGILQACWPAIKN